MTKIQELENDLKDVQNSLDAAISSKDTNAIATFTTFKKKIEDELAAENAKQPSSSQPPSNIPNSPAIPMGNNQPLLDNIVRTISGIMSIGSGTGADSAQVQAIIDIYFQNNKISLSQLDQDILDEIKKNQIKVLEIPQFAKKLTIDSSTANIPNLFDIIDDVLAGNNVYLIGEAGGGKTFTAETVAKILQREYVTLNCSQYTSPLEILGGQSVDGFKQGKLIDCWKNGKILIMDEMPKLDPNTAGLFNDALAKSSKTRPDSDAKINSANPDEPPIQRAKDFAIIATGNIYPNQKPAPQYLGNSQQDLSLLDRFSGSVYYTEFDNYTDQKMTRFKFLYKFLVGNYYDWIEKKKNKQTLPTPTGLRTIIASVPYTNLSLVSYRTETAFRVAFEFELVRAIAKKSGQNVEENGKTLLKTFKSYMVAFRETSDASDKIMRMMSTSDIKIQLMVDDAIKSIISTPSGFLDSLNEDVKKDANPMYQRYENFYVSQAKIQP
ncbi:MAG: AAA family ATPase [Candidatus Kapaibacteriota bacterium]